MIKAIIFDLDGTLVQTERLKALSYAQAAVELCPEELDPEQVVAAYQKVVGRSRSEVAQSLVDRFDLTRAARSRQADFGVATPWQAFVQVRLKIYHRMLTDPELLRTNRWPHNLDLLALAREKGCLTGLATMSHREQVNHILGVLELEEAFDIIATRDDVERGKPDPEIYLLVSQSLRVPSASCLVIEDSPSGVAAALAAEMDVVAVATPFTQEALLTSGLLPLEQIVTEPGQLIEIVSHVVAHHGSRF